MCKRFIPCRLCKYIAIPFHNRIEMFCVGFLKKSWFNMSFIEITLHVAPGVWLSDLSYSAGNVLFLWNIFVGDTIWNSLAV
jgi:hypothetical protein